MAAPDFDRLLRMAAQPEPLSQRLLLIADDIFGAPIEPVEPVPLPPHLAARATKAFRPRRSGRGRIAGIWLAASIAIAGSVALGLQGEPEHARTETPSGSPMKVGSRKPHPQKIAGPTIREPFSGPAKRLNPPSGEPDRSEEPEARDSTCSCGRNGVCLVSKMQERTRALVQRACDIEARPRDRKGVQLPVTDPDLPLSAVAP